MRAFPAIPGLLLAFVLILAQPIPSGAASAAAGEGGADATDLLDVLNLRTGSLEPSTLGFTPVPGPFFGMNPTAGTIWGVGVNTLFYLGDPRTTLLSSVDNLIAETSNRQFIFFSKSTLLTADNAWELQGDWRYYKFSQDTYGLGSGEQAPAGDAGTTSAEPARIRLGAQPLKFDSLRAHETVFRRLAGDLYAGLGAQVDYHDHIEDLDLNLADSPRVLTSEYAYSRAHGFDPARTLTAGVVAGFLFESRDHVLNAYRGQYLLLAYTFNPKFLGSSQDSQVFYGEYRAYLPLSAEEPRRVLAFWAFLNQVTRGDLPYLDLPASGYDVRERSSRGYAQGRWRGDGLAYAETEYRFPILASGLLGGVVFANAASVSRPAAQVPSLGLREPAEGLFEYVKPAWGAGARLLTVKEIRMNLEFDYARGLDGSGGVYINVYEIF